MILKSCENVVRWLSFEWLLDYMPNGGTAVLLRSLAVSLLIYAATIGLKSRLADGASWTVDGAALRSVVGETIPWFGAIFAGVYAAFYSRFASQWNYLAGLYNQLMAASISCPPDGKNGVELLTMWQAGFIEDAQELHLAKKAMFASVIHSLLKSSDVRHALQAHSTNGPERLKKLEDELQKLGMNPWPSAAPKKAN